MESIRKLIKANVPSYIMVPIIQGILSLPPAASRFIVADFTAPAKSQKSWIKMIEKDTWKGAWIGPDMSSCTEDELFSRIKAADLIIYKVHGGAFRIGNCIMYMDVFQSWINLLKDKHNIDALILSIDYSLAPEFKYPVPVLECVAAYEYLINTLQVPGSKIVLSGDSAGGSLCLETLIRIYAPEILTDLDAPRSNFDVELPAGLLLVSPLVSANTSEWLWEFTEDLVTPVLAERVLKEYLNLPEADTTDLHLLKLTHISSGYDRFAPKNILCYVGEREVMRDEILKLVDAVRSDGKTNVELRKENYEHDWYFIREVIRSEDKYLLAESDEQFADFAARCLDEVSTERLSITDEIIKIHQQKNHVIPEPIHLSGIPYTVEDIEAETTTLPALIA